MMCQQQQQQQRQLYFMHACASPLFAKVVAVPGSAGLLAGDILARAIRELSERSRAATLGL